MPLDENLPATFYVDPAVYEAERQSIFRRTWQLLGPASALDEAGTYLAVEVADWKIFVLRGRDGVLRAFHNVCRHRGAPLLATGSGRCDVLRCPYHLWLYDQEGRLRKAPWFGDDPAFKLEDHGLEPVSLEVWRGLLFIAIEPAEPLEQQLGALPDQVAHQPLESFAAVAEERFEIACNWKLYTDNFVEGYHVPGIHPGFYKTLEFEGFETVALDSLVRMSAPLKGGGFYGGTWMWAWPNWTLSVYPQGMNTSRINPLGPERAELIYHFYFADGVAEEDRRRTIEGNCQVVREDFGICEQTQANYRSGGFQTGPLSPRHEAGVAYFQGRLRRSLESAGASRT
ncbi:MAG: aromatic ring-hydroxylating dioxygenase subunit alpha [Pseudomonadota bacterium]